MTQKHPITPPPELVVEWADTIYQQTECDDQRDLYIATQAARWGADQELEACCVWLRGNDPYEHDYHQMLRAVRRPKPPSLKDKLKEAIYTENLGEALRLVEQLDDSL